jgi:hypothetical protein
MSFAFYPVAVQGHIHCQPSFATVCCIASLVLGGVGESVLELCLRPT